MSSAPTKPLPNPPSKPAPSPGGGAAAGAAGGDDDAGRPDGYKVPEKVGLSELMQKDAEDESLRRYKEQLLGAAATGAVTADPNDPRRVVITELKIIFQDRPGGDISYTLNTPEDIANMKKKPFVLKEKCLYKTQVTFRVQHDIVSGLRYVNKVYKAGIRVSKDEEMFGSYAPRPEPYSIVFPPNEWDEAPSGWLARGGFTAESQFVDDDGAKHLHYQYAFDLKSSWS